MKTVRVTWSLSSQSPNGLSLFHFIFCVCTCGDVLFCGLSRGEKRQDAWEERQREREQERIEIDEENCREPPHASGTKRSPIRRQNSDYFWWRFIYREYSRETYATEFANANINNYYLILSRTVFKRK